MSIPTFQLAHYCSGWLFNRENYLSHRLIPELFTQEVSRRTLENFNKIRKVAPMFYGNLSALRSVVPGDFPRRFRQSGPTHTPTLAHTLLREGPARDLKRKRKKSRSEKFTTSRDDGRKTSNTTRKLTSTRRKLHLPRSASAFGRKLTRARSENASPGARNFSTRPCSP